MSQERLAALIHEHTATIAALERRISTHEAIRLIQRLLVLEEITLGQAIGIDELGDLAAEYTPHALYASVAFPTRIQWPIAHIEPYCLLPTHCTHDRIGQALIAWTILQPPGQGNHRSSM